ncbi:MAG: hypothetical protein H6713_11675 [Myxococcales bacterium]|nr:hypothetical protein [Myxococcales bacterium]
MAPLPRPRAMVDDAIYGARAAFEPLAEVITAPGAAIDHDMLVETGAEILITRSVTRVDAALLEGTRVRFVGTATAGVDHVDQAALRARDIAFASAPGCNAPAVVHWVLTALTSACARAPARWRLHAAGGRVGVAIVGYGNVGRRLARRLRRLGATLWISDPPLARALERGDATLDARDRTELLRVRARARARRGRQPARPAHATRRARPHAAPAAPRDLARRRGDQHEPRRGGRERGARRRGGGGQAALDVGRASPSWPGACCARAAPRSSPATTSPATARRASRARRG